MTDLSKLLCRCGNQLGLSLPNGVVISRIKQRTVRIERGSIVCEGCGELTEVDSLTVPAVV